MARVPKPCKYGTRSVGIGALARCPKKPCKYGPRYPNEYQGKCPKESVEQKNRRRLLAKAARDAAEEKRKLNLARQLFFQAGTTGKGLTVQPLTIEN